MQHRMAEGSDLQLGELRFCQQPVSLEEDPTSDTHLSEIHLCLTVSLQSSETLRQKTSLSCAWSPGPQKLQDSKYCCIILQSL